MRQAPDNWIGTDPTLLVIEDAADGAALIRVAARKAYPLLDVQVAGDGAEGIAYLAAEPPFQHRWAHPVPALVILDLIMPKVDGFAVLEWVRQHRLLAPMPVVVLTASNAPNAEARARDLGAADFFRKPAGVDALAGVVGQLVTRWIRGSSSGSEAQAS
jgi:putative two-component system response regulator